MIVADWLPIDVKGWFNERAFIRETVDDIKYAYKKLKMPFILGVSGGVDSAVCAALLKKAKVPSYFFYIGIESSDSAWEGVKQLEEALGLEVHYTNMDASLNAVLTDTDTGCNLTVGKPITFTRYPHTVDGSVVLLVQSNVKARLRMIQQYAMANLFGGLVVGTENRSESYVGYATKYGDAACDVTLIDSLTKAEVLAVGKRLKIPQSILDKAPSADLWSGQTDEGELGFTYEDLDRYLLCMDNPHSKEIRDKIVHLHKSTRHKFKAPPNIMHLLEEAQDK